MNRPIKFRALIKPELKMVSVYSLEWTNLELAVSWLDDKTTTGKREVMAPFNYELTQFTGLTDKNGKEIYEGDIFNCIYDFDGCKKHKQAVVYVEVSARFITKDYGECHQPNVMQNMSDMIRMEVIGNIYENPELLI